MKRIAKKVVNGVLALAGLEIRRAAMPAPNFMKQALDLYQVDTIFDIGANIGQSGRRFRAMGFPGSIISFEPVLSLFEQLRANAAQDEYWHVENIALGDYAGLSEIHVSGGHASASSILEMTDNVRLNAPDQRVVRTEKIEVNTLDAMLRKHYPEGSQCFIKLDVQGYEEKVLRGGLQELARVVGLQVEMSLVKNYEGEFMLLEMRPYLYSCGFRLVHSENGWSNDISKELYQVDGVFFRTDALAQSESVKRHQ